MPVHIRTKTDIYNYWHYSNLCNKNQLGPSSISYEHYLARLTSKVIAGQINRLPEKVCEECIRLFNKE